MNIFEEALKNCDDGMRNCIFCDQKFKPDNRNLKRGWGLMPQCMSYNFVHSLCRCTLYWRISLEQFT